MNDLFNFGDFSDLFATNNNSFFVNTDIKTIKGRNLVKNWLCKIAFELGTYGYSDTSLELIEFYEECKKNKGMTEFFSNKVVAMIMQEMINMPKVRMYMKDRIFDEIAQEKIEKLNDTFDNNEELYRQVSLERQEFMRNEIIKQKEIKNLQKKHGISKDVAERMYYEKQAKNKFQEYISNRNGNGQDSGIDKDRKDRALHDLSNLYLGLDNDNNNDNDNTNNTHEFTLDDVLDVLCDDEEDTQWDFGT